MQKDFIRNFFTEVHRILMGLDNFIASDNILYTEKNLNDLETKVRKFRKQIKKAFSDLLAGRKYKEEMASDEL